MISACLAAVAECAAAAAEGRVEAAEGPAAADAERRFSECMLAQIFFLQ